jgi:hypothetical protein
MAEDTRPSLSKALDQRYDNQRAGGAFNVKQTLDSYAPGVVNGSVSSRATEFQSPAGFIVKPTINVTQFKDAQGTQSKQLSRYVRGLDNRRYRR